jgi:hypothetical protein
MALPPSRTMEDQPMKALRLIAGLVLGCVIAVIIARVGFSALRTAWPGYAAAEPEKAYTLGMLLARLAIAAILTAGAACAATLVAGDDGRSAWWLGGLFVLISLPPHLYYVWDDYPAWYHFVYLLSLVPVAGLSGRLLRAASPASPRAA